VNTSKRTVPLDPSNNYLRRNSWTLRAQRGRPELDRYYLIPVLLKALNILTFMDRSGEAVTVDDIHRNFGYPSSTIYRILRTLSACAYLPEGKSGVYRFTRLVRTKNL
jgi:uncharacterized membrane protein